MMRCVIQIEDVRVIVVTRIAGCRVQTMSPVCLCYVCIVLDCMNTS